MKKKHIITIEKPCNESWDQMPLSGSGRDCSKCEKNIRDFTKMSDNELIVLLRSNSSMCGRFTDEQLNRPLLADKTKLIPTLNLYAVAAGFGALICFPSFGAEKYPTQSNLNLIEVVQGKEALPATFLDTKNDSLTKIVICDDYQHVMIANAKVQLFDDQGNLIDSVFTDERGIASYKTVELERYRVNKIHISTSEEYKDKTIIWTPDGEQRILVKLESTLERERPPRVFMGVVARPRVIED